MEKILISACLLGDPVRYDGASKPINHPLIHELNTRGCLLPFCPEVSGGLPIPRPPAEICGGDGRDVVSGVARVMTKRSEVTQSFVRGGRAALALARAQGVRLALLKEGSPSCGSSFIYDGSFSGKKIQGVGVTTALLEENKILVVSEDRIQDLGLWVNR